MLTWLRPPAKSPPLMSGFRRWLERIFGSPRRQKSPKISGFQIWDLPQLSRAPLPACQPPCRIHPSQRNCWITSSTTYTTQETCSRVAASSLNHGSLALEDTFSPMSSSTPRRAYKPGRTRFRTLLPPPHVTPGLFLLETSGKLSPRMRKRVVGSRPFLASTA